MKYIPYRGIFRGLIPMYMFAMWPYYLLVKLVMTSIKQTVHPGELITVHPGEPLIVAILSPFILLVVGIIVYGWVSYTKKGFEEDAKVYREKEKAEKGAVSITNP